MSDFSLDVGGLHEECGVFGIYDSTGQTDMVSAVYSALYALQHRGQESCGIALNVDGVLSGHRDLGLVSEVFTKRVLEDLPKGAKMATGHVRYATSGKRSRSNAQPMVLHHCKGAMAICHNGNLTNAARLRHKLEMSGSIFHGTSDTEVIGYLLTQNRLVSPDIETAVCRTMEQIEGAYSLVIMTHTKLIAARDPHGFRPLCIGELPDGAGYAFASESCALDAVGARMLRDVEPGEIVVADRFGLRSIRTHCNTAPHTLCVFEYIYFARPDSVIEGTCVHEARLQAGRFLAQEHPVEADVVIGAPDSGRWAMRWKAAFPTASALSKTSMWAAPSSRAARPSGKTACASSSTPSPPPWPASGWCWWTTRWCGAPPAPAPSACCGTPVPRRSITASRPRPSPIPVISAPIFPTRSC